MSVPLRTSPPGARSSSSLRSSASFRTDPATTETYTLSLHDALPISFDYDVSARSTVAAEVEEAGTVLVSGRLLADIDRKSTRLNSSHVAISYAVFCLIKKMYTRQQQAEDLIKHDVT